MRTFTEAQIRDVINSRIEEIEDMIRMWDNQSIEAGNRYSDHEEALIVKLRNDKFVELAKRSITELKIFAKDLEIELEEV